MVSAVVAMDAVVTLLGKIPFQIAERRECVGVKKGKC